MSDDAAENEEGQEGEKQLEDAKRPVNKLVFIGLIVMIAAVGGSIFAAFKFVEDERARSLQEWQIRLGIVGDSRSAAINDWIDDNFSTIRELAENASLQLYMSEIAAAKNPQAAADAPRWQVIDKLNIKLEEGMNREIITGLKQKSHKVTKGHFISFGGAQLIYKLDDGYVAASEPRKDGQAVGF